LFPAEGKGKNGKKKKKNRGGERYHLSKKRIYYDPVEGKKFDCEKRAEKKKGGVSSTKRNHARKTVSPAREATNIQKKTCGQPKKRLKGKKGGARGEPKPIPGRKKKQIRPGAGGGPAKKKGEGELPAPSPSFSEGKTLMKEGDSEKKERQKRIFFFHQRASPSLLEKKGKVWEKEVGAVDDGKAHQSLTPGSL